MRRLLTAVLIGGVSIAAAQGPEGTAIVRGRVIDAANGKPLPNLALRFGHRPRGANAPGIGPQPPDRSAMTNADGVFEVLRLAAGDYAVYSSGPVGDYLPVQYGGNAPGAPPKLLTVAEGARLDITIKAWRGATIQGHVFDERGRPIVGASVRVFSDDPDVYGTDSTDDRGVYEISRLRPGRYAVGVPLSLWNRTISSTPRQGSPAGSMHLYAMDRAGRTILMVNGAPLAPSADDGRTRVYEVAFAGGGATRATAATYALSAGELRSDADITLPAVRGTRVAGVVSAPGKVDGTLLSLTRVGTSSDVEGRISATAATDGTFVFVAVPPGQYILTGYRQLPPLTEVTLSNGSPMMGHDDVTIPDADDAWLEMPISIGDADVNDLALALRPGTAISGRIVFEDGVAPPTASQWPRIQLGSMAARTRPSPEDRHPAFGPDGIMSMRIKPGTYRILSRTYPPGRRFKTAIVNGIEIGDGPLVVGAEPISDIQFVFGRYETLLRGAVTDSTGQPVSRASVMVFPVDRSRWLRLDETDDGRIAEVRAGTYEVSSLAPGDYYVVAVDDYEAGLYRRFLETFVADATRVSLRAQQPLTVSLTVRGDKE